jgi:hypothetical protein
MRRIYQKYLADNATPYIPPYSADGVPYPPKLYKVNTVANTGAILNAAANVVTDTTPQIPEPLYDLLVELEEITP